MTSSNQTKINLVDVLQQFSVQYIEQYQLLHKHLPLIEQDENWPSPCELTLSDDDTINPPPLSTQVFWRPTLIEKEKELNFDNVESALEIILHEDIKRYFTAQFSENLDASCEEGQLTLLFAWNEADFERLQENLIGHILMKRRLKQAETVFFGVTDEEDMIISVDNDSGAVWVERVGCKPHKKLAESLPQFIRTLIPRVS
jgi:SecY interacting protein Syd